MAESSSRRGLVHHLARRLGSGPLAQMSLARPVEPVQTRPMDQYSAALDRAHHHSLDWLSSLEQRPVPPQASIDQVTLALGAALPNDGSDAAEVVDLLAEAC